MDPVRHLRFSLAILVGIVGIKKGDGQMVFNPASANVIEAEDILITLGEQASIRNLEGIAGGSDV